MKIDLYAKVVLTVFVVCLCVIAFRSVPLAGAGLGQAVDIVTVNGLPVYRAPLPVKLAK